MRRRFNPNAISSATPDGNTGYNHATHKAHLELVNKRHEEFITSGLNTTFIAVNKPPRSIKDMSAQEIRRRFQEYCFFNVWLPVRKKSDYELNNLKLTIENWR